jgi:hypothetical protein
MDYFPLDTDMDDNFECIEAKYGVQGFGILIKMYQKIYHDYGYYYPWTEREQLLFSKHINVDIATVNAVIHDAAGYGIFDLKILESHQVLTSRGIQKRYILMNRRRKHLTLFRDLWLLPVGNNPQNVDNNAPVIEFLSYKTTGNDDNNAQIGKGEIGKRESGNESASTQTPVDASPPPPPLQTREQTQDGKTREARGTFGNVVLTDEEYHTLCHDYGGTPVDREIEKLSAHMQSAHKVYADHYATLTKWLIQDKVPKRPPDYFDTHQRDDFTPEGRHAFRDALSAAADKLPRGLRQFMAVS